MGYGNKGTKIVADVAEVQQDLDHVPKFTGDIWFVDDGVSASGDGTQPDTAFKTIGEAITAMSDGDAITIKAGTYTETGLDLSNDAAEMWFEVGVVIDPASGTALTISGDYCRLRGNHKITPGAGETALAVSGAECIVNGCKILNGAIGMLLTGQGVVVNDCAVGFPTTTAYDIQAVQGRLYRCKTVGNAATTGYKINGGVDTGVLENCTSSGHTTAGFSIATGSQDWTVFNCSSGGGDGKRADADSANVWSNYSYADHLYHTTTFAGAGPTTENLYRVYGSVSIKRIYADVDTVLSADIGATKIETDDGTVQRDITTAFDISSAPVGSFIGKTGAVGAALDYDSSASATLIDWIADLSSGFTMNAKNATASYIRVNYAGVGTSGVLQWHCQWAPLTENGNVIAE